MKSQFYDLYTKQNLKIKNLDWIQIPNPSFQANLDIKQKNLILKLVKELFKKELKIKPGNHTQITKFLRDKIKKAKWNSKALTNTSSETEDFLSCKSVQYIEYSNSQSFSSLNTEANNYKISDD